MADESLLDEHFDMSKLKVPDLRKILKSRNLTTSGNKMELVERLEASIKSKIDNIGSTDGVDDLDEDLLNDDDSDHDHIEASESVLTEFEEQLDASPTNKGLKRKADDEESPTHLDSKPLKKIVLNRSQSSVSGNASPDSKIEDILISDKTADQDDNENDSPDKKTVKLSELSAKERFELRAKKFGAPTTDEGKKVARAQRFSIEVTSPVSSSPIASKEDPVTLDALKKRAERFGGSVSTVMSSLEQQERIEKRKARFGVIANTNGTSSNDKAKKRLERFKTPIK